MEKFLLIFILLLIVNIAFATEGIQWTRFTQDDKNEVIEISTKFLKAFEERDKLTIKSMLCPDEMNFGGEIWMPTDGFIGFLQAIQGNKDFEYSNLRAFVFDDCETSQEAKDYAMKIYRIFDNRKIFTVYDLIIHSERGIQKSFVGTLYYKDLQNDKWIITSLFGFNTDLSIKGSGCPCRKERWKIEEFPDYGIKVPMLKSFSIKETIGNIINFYMPRETSKDAVYKIFSVELSSPINVLSYKWVELFLKDKQHSEIKIKYLPYGYLYEFDFIDDDGRSNKGIIIAIENKNKAIFVQYFSSLEVYDKIRTDIEYSIRYIEVIK